MSSHVTTPTEHMCTSWNYLELAVGQKVKGIIHFPLMSKDEKTEKNMSTLDSQLFDIKFISQVLYSHSWGSLGKLCSLLKETRGNPICETVLTSDSQITKTQKLNPWSHILRSKAIVNLKKLKDTGLELKILAYSIFAFSWKIDNLAALDVLWFRESNLGWSKLTLLFPEVSNDKKKKISELRSECASALLSHRWPLMNHAINNFHGFCVQIYICYAISY